MNAQPLGVSTPTSPRELRLLCMLVPCGPYGSLGIPVHTMRAMPLRACVTGKWGLLGPSGFVLRETHARAPSAKVLVRCLRQRQANAFRANPRTVRAGGLIAWHHSIGKGMDICTACESAEAELDSKCATCTKRYAAWLAGEAYQYSPKDCPICNGKPLAPLRIGRHSCNLCGNTSRAAGVMHG